jgi:hypothetical protein
MHDIAAAARVRALFWLRRRVDSTISSDESSSRFQSWPPFLQLYDMLYQPTRKDSFRSGIQRALSDNPTDQRTEPVVVARPIMGFVANHDFSD